jgi:hypothetical protein
MFTEWMNYNRIKTICSWKNTKTENWGIYLMVVGHLLVTGKITTILHFLAQQK